MKAIDIFASLLLVMPLNSCTTYYYVVTDVDRALSVERSVYTSGADGGNAVFPFVPSDGWELADADSAFEVDFHDVREKMKHMAQKKALDIGDVLVGDKGASSPLLSAEESLDKRFRWFYTYYDYRAAFKGIRDMLPLPYEGYFTDEQLELFFRGGNPPGDWNGIEMYYLLDDINQNFARWYSDATYFVLCDIFEPYCTRQQVAVLDASKERFMEGVEREAMFAMKPDEFEDRLAVVAPGAGFGRIYEDNAAALDDAYVRESGIIDCFEESFVYSIDMPGRYVGGNAENFIDGNPSWKVDAYRLMYGDLVLEATTRKVNVWAFVLTFAVIALLLQAFSKMFAG